MVLCEGIVWMDDGWPISTADESLIHWPYGAFTTMLKQRLRLQLVLFALPFNVLCNGIFNVAFYFLPDFYASKSFYSSGCGIEWLAGEPSLLKRLSALWPPRNLTLGQMGEGIDIVILSSRSRGWRKRKGGFFAHNFSISVVACCDPDISIIVNLRHNSRS